MRRIIQSFASHNVTRRSYRTYLTFLTFLTLPYRKDQSPRTRTKTTPTEESNSIYKKQVKLNQSFNKSKSTLKKRAAKICAPCRKSHTTISMHPKAHYLVYFTICYSKFTQFNGRFAG